MPWRMKDNIWLYYAIQNTLFGYVNAYLYIVFEYCGLLNTVFKYIMAYYIQWLNISCPQMWQWSKLLPCKSYLNLEYSTNITFVSVVIEMIHFKVMELICY